MKTVAKVATTALLILGLAAFAVANDSKPCGCAKKDTVCAGDCAAKAACSCPGCKCSEGKPCSCKQKGKSGLGDCSCANCGGKGMKAAHPGPQMMLEKMTKELGLSAEQQTQLKAVMSEHKTKIETILTPEQREKFEKNFPGHKGCGSKKCGGAKEAKDVK